MYPRRHSDEEADRRRLEKLSIVRTLPNVAGRSVSAHAGRTYRGRRSRHAGLADGNASQTCGRDRIKHVTPDSNFSWRPIRGAALATDNFARGDFAYNDIARNGYARNDW